MRNLALAAVVCVCAACGAVDDVVDELTLSEAEIQDIADNAEGALTAYQELADFAVKVATGEVEIQDYDYTEPTEQNDWTATLHHLGNQFPGGDGEVTITFSVLEDATPVDPFAPGSLDGDVLDLHITITFAGRTSAGAPLELDADFTTLIDRTDPSDQVVTTDGTYRIRHNDYVANLLANAFRYHVDSATEISSQASGSVTGDIDIPEFAFDADVDVRGNGDVVDVEITILDQTVEDSRILLSDF